MDCWGGGLSLPHGTATVIATTLFALSLALLVAAILLNVLILRLTRRGMAWFSMTGLVTLLGWRLWGAVSVGPRDPMRDAAALLVSGLALWFTSSIPRELQAVRYLAVLVHAVAALATIGGIIIHIYMGVAVVPDGLHAILHGDVSEQWARHHHGLWAAEAPRIRTSGSHAERDSSIDLGR